MITISPDTVGETAAMRRRHGIAMRMLSDDSLAVTDLYNLRHEKAIAGGGRGLFRHLAIPATILIGADGLVKWLYRSTDYRVRSNPDDVLLVARKLIGSEARTDTSSTKTLEECETAR